MATTQLNVPQVFTKTCREDFHQHTPQRPYITFKLGPRKLQRLVIKVWSNDQGWCDNHLKTEDPYANSQTWFSLGLIEESTPGQKATSELYEFQRNVRASSTMRCYTNEWNLGMPMDSNDNGEEVHAWIESLSESEGVVIGVFPVAMYPGWVNTVWNMEVMVHSTTRDETRPSEHAAFPDGPNRASFLNNVDIQPSGGYLQNQLTVNFGELININQEAVEATPPGFPNWASLLNNLGIRLGDRYSRTGAMADLEEAIKVSRQAVEASPPDHPDRAAYLNNLGNRLRDRYWRIRAMADLEEAIKVSREAIEATPPNHPNQPMYLNNLGIRLGDRYSRTRAMADLEEAIKVIRQAVEANPPDYPNRAAFLHNFGNRLRDKYLRTRAMADLEEAIKVGREAVAATPADHRNRPMCLNSLGIGLSDRYSRIGAMADLEEAIKLSEEALKATPADHPEWPGYFNSLGNRLRDRYLQTTAMADLEEAIKIGRKVIQATPLDDSKRAGRLNNLGIRLSDKFSRIGAMADLEEAVQLSREAIEATPVDHPELPEYLTNFGDRLGDRYSRIGAMIDLEEAINIGRKVIQATPLDDSKLVGRLNSLGNRLSDRYSRIGAMADLEEAIKMGRKAVEAIPPDHSDRPGHLNNLGNRLHNRYSRVGAMADLEEAINMGRQAVKAITPDHRDRPMHLNNLAHRLCERYSRIRAANDLDEGIEIGREAVEATPPDHPDRAGRLNNLGASLGQRYSRTKAVADLEEFIKMCREAVKAVPPDHPDRPKYLNNLGNGLHYRYHKTLTVADLEQAIKMAREAVEGTPPNHPDRAGRLTNLGINLRVRYSETTAMADLEEAKDYFISSLRHPTSYVRERLVAGSYFLATPGVLGDKEAYAIAEETTNLIPLLSTRSLQNSDKRHLLSEAVGIASIAAAIALHSDKGPAAAIKLLETGRAIIAGSLFERSDLATLEREQPHLAQSFVDMRDLLDAPVPNYFLDTTQQQVIAIDAEANRRRDAQSRLPELLDEIRSNHGFDRFLLSASEADMVEAARYGPIVVLNVSSHRCDALVIQHSDTGSGVSGIKLLELPHLSHNDLDEHAKSPGTLNTLEWLWDFIVHPVFDFLGFNEALPSNQWPHIWWIPTGILSHFPLHAAGYHRKRTGETALDRVVSSYASSVKGIIRSRQRPYQPAPTGGSRIAVVVSMQNTPKQQSLRYADEEIDVVSAICKSKGILDRRPRGKRDVLSALKACDIFHFAGHGGTDPLEPLHSKLFLDDWQSEPFTVATLLETNPTANLPFLAYLSACGTGQILHKRSVDESIHLANAFQLAGFRHVIGTLWSVDDKLCVDIARLFYKYLMENMEDESVSQALHQATRTLRDKSVGGPPRDASVDGRPRDVVVSDKVEQTQPLWVPYVHFGV